MKKALIASVVLSSLSLFAIYLIKSNDKRSLTSDPGYMTPRTVRYSFTIKNTTNALIKKGIFKAFGPVKKTSFQTCTNITASQPFAVESDSYGNQVLVFDLEHIPPYGSKIVSVTAELLLSKTPNSIPEKNLDIWLQPDTYIESNQKDIIKTALSLKKTTIEETEEKILNMVADHITYSGYTKNPKGALYAFTQKKGDCTEYMYLFTALSRAAGIPSRGIGGYIVSKNTILNPEGFHNWSEFYNKGRWQVSDPQNREFMKNGHTYIAMQIIPPSKKSNKICEIQFNRFYVEGNGLTAKIN